MISYKKLLSHKGLIKLKKKVLFLENNTNSDNLANVSNETNKRNCIQSVQVRKIPHFGRVTSKQIHANYECLT